MSARPLLLCLSFLCFTPTVYAQLMIPDITNSQVMLFDATDGSLLDRSFIDMTAQGGFPVNAVTVGVEIWVSNQTNRTIHRFDLAGSYLGDVSGELDYVRGMDVSGDKVYAVNSGQNTGHPERTGVAVIDIESATVEGFFPTGSDANGYGFDVLSFKHEAGRALLIADQSSIDQGLEDGQDIDIFDIDGNFVETFHDSDGSTGIDNPMQLAAVRRQGILAAGFTGPLFGIFKYDRGGSETDFYLVPDRNVFGLAELANGRILFTTFGGVFVLNPNDPDPNSNVRTVVPDIVAAFVEPLRLPRSKPALRAKDN